MVWIQRLYSIYVALWFIVLFLLLFPVFLLAIAVPSWWRIGGYVNHVWARIFFPLIAMPHKVEGLEKLKGIDTPVIFCANHFSYADIPTMGLLPRPFVFVGKSSIAKVPLFGYMFRKLHITVDRGSLKSRYETFTKSTEAIKKGKNLVLFPEGGIVTRNPPHMARFKDGAFRIAINEKIPIVPVTIPNNWVILTDDGRYLPKIRRCRLIIHEPLKTDSLTEADVDVLKDKCHSIIENSLKEHFPDLFESQKVIH